MAAYGAPLGFYIHERNAKVSPSNKVMTPEHIRNLTLRYLARMGIRVGGKKRNRLQLVLIFALSENRRRGGVMIPQVLVV